MGQYKRRKLLERRVREEYREYSEALKRSVKALEDHGLSSTYMDDILYLIGALRDGSVYKDVAARNYVVAYYQKNREWLENSVGKRIKRLGFKYRIDEPRSGQFRLRVYSKKLYNAIRELFEFPPEGKGQEDWGVPEMLKKLPPFLLTSFIKGLFDAEGDISPKSSKSLYIGISQKNKELLEFVKNILEKLGIKTGEIHLIDSRTKTLRLAIGSYESIIRFIKLIGCEHPDKKSRLLALLPPPGQQT